jgi:hypothetical protein
MIQDFSTVLHAGHGQISFLIYLYRVLLHLLAFAVLGLFTRWLLGVFGTMTAETATQSNAEKQEP